MVTDHKGNKFNTEKEMCEYWGVNYDMYRSGKRSNWELEECLRIVPHISLNNKRIIHTYLTNNLYLKKLHYINGIIYCECILDNNPIVIHSEVVRSICREYNTNRILSNKNKVA